ncbi:hypothetical protein [Lichenifustis flavocetrariae]|uniref:Uncharacterized protein n=1 Tax=Lichenifustis flavocetrariae TaxID=2949735 RepID=A0AA41Z9H8_9HYPH|nr:hypothetical protein [Lichenifustis flavocetrariae]MCW6511772.1 hypothetical protein [Lichenifustis flavocetrariae]
MSDPSSAAFQCPATNPSSESGSSVAADAVLQNDPSVSSSVMTAIDRLRAKGLKSGEIVDQLVTSYCSRIGSEAGLSDESKAEQVRQFASSLASVVFRSPGSSPEDTLINVPVPTKLYDQLRQAAKTAKVSESAWMLGAIRNRLAAP